MPAIPSWLLEPLWDQFSALLPDRPACDPSHPLGCRRPRVSGRLIFEKLTRVLRSGCSCAGIAGRSCGAAAIRERRNEWTGLGVFADLGKVALESYDRVAGLALKDLIIDGCIATAPGGGEMAGRSPVDRGKPGMKRSVLTEGKGIAPDRAPAPANRHDSALLASAPGKLDESGPLPEGITVHPDAGCDSQKTRDELESRRLNGEIAHKGGKAPIRAGRRWPVERANARHNGFSRLQRCYERDERVIDAFFDLADAIITLRRLIREARTLYRRDTRPAERP